jgi:hypothetical protein
LLSAFCLLLFAFLPTHNAKAQQNVRDRFLVDKIYANDGYGLIEYIYDENNRLIKAITTGRTTYPQTNLPVHNITNYEYENGRVSKIQFIDSMDLIHGYDFNYDMYFFYNAQGQLIRSEEHKDGFMYHPINYHYENGRVVSTYGDGTMPFQYDTLFYDHAGNMTKQSICFGRWKTYHYEYDNNIKPNLGIDHCFLWNQPLLGPDHTLMLAAGLSQNNMTRATGEGYVMTYTYNEYGLPETYQCIFEENPPLEPLIFTIEYRQITSGIPEPEQSKLAVYPNPTTGELHVTNVMCDSRDVEIFDMLGRLQKVEGRRQKAESKFPSFGGVGVVDISHLPAGIYFLRVQTEKGVVTEKVIKQ